MYSSTYGLAFNGFTTNTNYRLMASHNGHFHRHTSGSGGTAKCYRTGSKPVLVNVLMRDTLNISGTPGLLKIGADGSHLL